MTPGLLAPGFSTLRRRSVSRPTRSSNLSFNVARTSAGSALPVMRASVFRSSTSCAEASAPTSASSSVSSTSSQSDSDRLSLAKMSNSALPKGLPDLASLALSRVRREPTDSGVSVLAGSAVDSATAGLAAGLTDSASAVDLPVAAVPAAAPPAFSLSLAASASAVSRASAAALASRVRLSSGAVLPIARSKSRLRDLPSHTLRAITTIATTITPAMASTVFISISAKSSPQTESPPIPAAD